MSRFRRLTAPHEEVQMEIRLIERYTDDEPSCYVSYRGTQQDLIASGAATQAMTEKAGAGKRRYDAQGRRFTRETPNRNGLMTIRYACDSRKEAATLPHVPFAWRYALPEISKVQRAEYPAKSDRESAS